MGRYGDLFRYEKQSGRLLWKGNRKGVTPGMEAGFMFNGQKYVTVDKERVLVKKIVWYLNTGSWPAFKLYPIDGNAQNTRFENLGTQRRKAKPKFSGNGVTIKQAQTGWTVEANGRPVATDGDLDKILAAAKALLLY